MNSFAMSKRFLMVVMSSLLLILLFSELPSDVMATTAAHPSREQASPLESYSWGLIKLVPNADPNVVQAALLKLQTQGLVRQVKPEASSFRVLASPDAFSELRRLKDVAQVVEGAATEPSPLSTALRPYWLLLKPTDESSTLPALFRELATLQAKGMLFRQDARQSLQGESQSLKVLAAPRALERLRHLPNVLTVTQHAPTMRRLQGQGSGGIAGTVTDSEGNSLADINVTAYQYSPEEDYWLWINSSYTLSDGSYEIGGLPDGDYRVGFWDDSGNYIPQYYDDQANVEGATDILVTGGMTTSAIDASLAQAAHITGMVTDAEGNPLADISVAAYRYNEEWDGWEWLNDSYSNSDGSYDVGNLNTDTYRVGFYDYSGTYVSEYYDDAPNLESATDISVTVGMTTSEINASLSEGGHITGMVMDSSGNPLADIGVTAYQYDSDYGYWMWAGGSYTLSDGSYDIGGLPTGDYRVGFWDDSGVYIPQYYDNQVNLESGADISVTAGMTTSEINASLSEGGHITGMVMDSSGNPLADISVTAYQYDSDYNYWMWIRSSYTLSDGSYDIGGLPTGDYRVGFWDDSGVYISQYYDNQANLESGTDISVTAGMTTSEINASLSEGGHITGMVMDSSSNALADISVTAYQYDSDNDYWMWIRGSYTLSDGSYDIGGLPSGDYRVGFWDDSGVYISQYYDNQVNLESGADISVTAGMTTSEIDASLSEGGHITGIVMDSSGNALADIGVTAYQYDSDYNYWMWIRSSYTLSDGSYDIGGLATGDYRVGFWDDSGEYVPQYYNDAPMIESGMDVHVMETETTANIDAMLDQAGHITGVVTDVDGNGLEGMTVDVFRYNAGWDSWEWMGATNTDNLGQYDLGGLATDLYRVGFWDYLGNYASEYYDDASMLESATDVSVMVGSTTSEIDAVLIESGRITGTITDADGNPLPNINIEVYRYREDWSYWENVGYAYSDEEGFYNVGGLNTGPYQVGFFDYSGNYIPEYYHDMTTLDNANDVAVSAGSTTSDINAQLSQGGHISGLVTNDEGQPLSGISIDVYRYNAKWDYWQWVAYGYTDYAGMYDAGGLATDSYRISFSDWQGSYLSEYYNDQPAVESAEDIAVTVGETTSGIDAQLSQAGSISGSVTNADGTPLPNIGLDLYVSDGNGEWYWAGWGYSNYLGQYSIGNLVTGSYRVGFYDWSGQYYSKYYENASDLLNASDVSVMVGEPTTGIDVMLEEGGHIKGQVTSQSSGSPLAGIEVVAYRQSGSDWEWMNSAVTDQDGMYDLSGLGTGSYQVGFFEASGSYAYEYYDDQMSIEEATEVSVIAGESTLEIDALLADPADAVANANSGSGSVVIDPQTGQLTIMQPVGKPTDITLSVALSCSDGTSPTNVMLHVGSHSYSMSNADGLFSATIPASKLENGAQISINYLCGDEEVTLVVGIIVLYDPSGYITDAATHQPITGATVTLYQVPGWQARSSAAQNNSANTCESNNSKSANQSWSQAAPTTLGILAVANSGQIDPALNPLSTNEEGYYGWDVAAGCWYVVVEAEGYQTLTSPVVGVPPAVTDLDLQLTRSAIPAVHLSQNSYQVSENSGSLDINVTLTAPLAETITVNYSTANGSATAGSDYSTATGVLTFEAGETNKTVTVTILNDNTDEPNETLSLTLSSPTNATLGSQKVATVTIVDDDEANTGGMKLYLPLIGR